MLVELAASGLQVVRLKGGDPFIFGRITEEIESLRVAEIDFEIIPGITSAMGAAAAAEIPLTDRRRSHGLVFLAGHHLPGADSTNWEAVVAMKTTVVIYMPGRHYSEIAQKLTQAGLPSDTPCAVISRATTPDEQVHLTTVRDLKKAPQLSTPTLLVIGDVLRFAKDSMWRDNPAPSVSDAFPATIADLESDSVELLGTRGSTI
jgi:siroheme synthase